MIILLLG